MFFPQKRPESAHNYNKWLSTKGVTGVAGPQTTYISYCEYTYHAIGTYLIIYILYQRGNV